MTKLNLLARVFVIVGILTFVSFAEAQELPLVGGISATGNHAISLKPEKIRLMMWVKAQGVDARGAISALAEHKERVKKDLVSMKADEASIVFSSTRVSEGSGGDDPNAQRYQRMMMMQMQQNGGGGDEAPEMPTTFTATAAVKAEWTLPVQEGDALAMLPVTLNAQIKARDLAGDNNKPELDAEQQEQLEEMQAMMQEQMGYYSSSDTTQGPSVTFISSATDAQVMEATKLAFKAAVADAKSMFDATGLKLGKLVAVSNRSNAISEMRAMYYPDPYGRSSTQFPANFTSSDKNLISAANSDELTMTIAVMVNFAIAE